MLFRDGEPSPQGLKPASIAALSGTAEAVPYPKLIYETSSIYFLAALRLPLPSRPASGALKELSAGPRVLDGAALCAAAFGRAWRRCRQRSPPLSPPAAGPAPASAHTYPCSSGE